MTKLYNIRAVRARRDVEILVADEERELCNCSVRLPKGKTLLTNIPGIIIGVENPRDIAVVKQHERPS